ncbi:small ribosomal subunit protein uS11m isoform X6 [Pongo pygmaeus]|uniref:small ribosomal subunit protein uS11m isoform X4 n=1 Tax=Pongo abelii TaxID=9601 RepID=UPI000CEF9675|nr:28S ribosomal protein S11, mitochondrial isoform X5 [Pongo abelii]XP_054307314.1 28S ribosomal protein S11, mitochondrial isoform X7 [Pongo pygmaeus]
MQAVRNVGSWFLRSWTWTQTTGVVARTPAGTIHTGARQLQDAAAKQKVEVKAAPSHTKFRVQILSMVDEIRNRGLTVFFKLWEEEPTKDLKIMNMGILAGTRKMGSMNENPFS